jgi:copper chaperone
MRLEGQWPIDPPRATFRHLTFAPAQHPNAPPASNMGLAMIRFNIPDMNCGHCRASIEAALTPMPGVTALRFDSEARNIEVEGSVPAAEIIQALDAIGFPAKVVN